MTEYLLQYTDDLFTLAEKRAHLVECSRLRAISNPERFPVLVPKLSKLNYEFYDYAHLVRIKSSFVKLGTVILMDHLRKVSGHSELQSIMPVGNTLEGRLRGHKIHVSKAGQQTGFHHDSATKVKGKMLLTVVLTLSVTVDGNDTLDPMVLQDARDRDLLPKLRALDANTHEMQDIELFTGRTVVHNGLTQIHGVTKLKPGVERTCLVMFASENTEFIPFAQRIPRLLRDSVVFYPQIKYLQKHVDPTVSMPAQYTLHIIVPVVIALIVLGVIAGGVVAVHKKHNK
jgi:hypothetical protein